GIIMSQNIEIESKNILTSQEFQKLLNKLPFPKQGINQTNYYFDTGNMLLRKLSCALRIRKIGETYHLTLKEPHHNGILETHDQLTKNESLNCLNHNIMDKEHTGQRLKHLD